MYCGCNKICQNSGKPHLLKISSEGSWINIISNDSVELTITDLKFWSFNISDLSLLLKECKQFIILKLLQELYVAKK